MNNRQMPTFKELFVESWEVFKSSFGNLFVLSLVGSIIGIGAMVAIFLGVAGMGFMSAYKDLSSEGFSNVQNFQELLTPERLGVIGIVVFLTFLISVVISSIVKLAVIYAAGKSKDKPSVGECFRAGFVNLVPVAVIGVVVFFLTFGSWFLLIVPGVFVSLYLQFVAYEMVLGGKRWFGGIRGSVQIMSQNLGEVLLRMIVLMAGVGVLYELPMYLLGLIAGGKPEEASAESLGLIIVLTSIKIIIGTCIGFYGIAYSVVTYQHAKKVTNEELAPSISWMVIVSIIGWLIAILLGNLAFKTLQSPMFKEGIKMAAGEVATNVEVNPLTEQERIAGWKEKMKPEVKAYFEVSKARFAEMKSAGSDTKKVKSLNDSNILTLKKALEIDSDNPEIWAALSDAYTWVNSKGTLNEALEASKKAEALDPVSWGYANRTGNILLMLGKNDEAILKFKQVIRAEDEYGRAHISLGVAYKRAGIKDLAKEELQKGIDILEKYNEGGSYDVEILNARKEMGVL